MMKGPRIAVSYLVLALAVSSVMLVLAGCIGESQSGNHGRLILIGIDGASPRLVGRLFAEERLPNLAALARRGVRGKLRSELPLFSPRIWNTIVTGLRPKEHGITSFFKTGKKGQDRLFTSVDRRAPALWTIVNEAGLSVGVVNFWNTHPLEAVDGVMVSDHVLAREIEGMKRMNGTIDALDFRRVVHPLEWSSRLVAALRERATPLPDDFESPFAEPRPIPDWVHRSVLQRRYAEDAALARIAEVILDEAQPDVMLVLLPGIDRVSHYLWGTIEPVDVQPPDVVASPETPASGQNALLDYYVFTDALIGILLKSFGPGHRVMIVSDHGFEAGRALMNLTGVHESSKAQDGVLFAAGPGIIPGGEAEDVSIYDIAPTLLAWLGLPAGVAMDGRIAPFLHLDEALAPVDYSSLEPQLVQPPTEDASAEAELVKQLKALGYAE